MLQLQTFGALDLTREDGTSVDVVLSQPKRALLLAWLACATPRGYQRRDVIVALFWPELDAERARGALRQSLHFLRTSLGEALVTRGDEIAIDQAVLASDVAAFERAVSEERHEDALALYRGDFLPGVFARDAPDAEHWIGLERARLGRLAQGSTWALADQAAEADPGAAADWAERAARIAPGDEGVLRRRMSLLQRVGDRAAALRVYDEFVVALHRDYPGSEPSLESRNLRDAIVRSREAAAAPRPPERTLRPTPRTAPALPSEAPGVRELRELREPRTSGSIRVRRAHGAPRWGRLTALAVAMIGVGALFVAAVRGTRLDPRRGAHRGVDQAAERTVAVMPFTIRGGRLQYLRDGMVDLLSMSLDGAGDIHTVEPVALLGYLAHDSSDDDSFERHRAAALRFGAGTFVVGTIVDVDGTLQARAALYAARDSAEHPISVATAASDEAHVVAMVDALTRGLVAGLFRSPSVRLTRLAAQTTQSLPALKSYLRGTQALRVGQYDAAIDAFESAVHEDSSFALAFYGLSMARGWASGGADRRATVAAQLAVANARGLSPHDSLLLVAHLHHWNGNVLAAEREYRGLLVAYPHDAEAWHELGEVIFHNGAETGHAMRDAREAFTRVAEVEALRVSALTHLARIAAIDHDSAAIDSLAALGQAVAPSDPRVTEMLVLQTFVTGDPVDRAAVVRESAALGDRALWSRSWDVANYASAFREAEALAAILTHADRTAVNRAMGWTMIAQFRAAAGRPRAARAAIEAAATVDPARAAYARALLASLPWLPATPAELTRARTELARWDHRIPPFDEGADPASVYSSIEAVRADLGAAIDLRLGTEAKASGGPSASTAPGNVLRMGVVALTQPGRSPEALRGDLAVLETTRPIDLRGVTPDEESLLRLARAELYRNAGRPTDAEHWFASFPAFGANDAMYRAWATRGLAVARAAHGDAEGADRARAELAWLWRDAEPPVRRLMPIP